MLIDIMRAAMMNGPPFGLESCGDFRGGWSRWAAFRRSNAHIFAHFHRPMSNKMRK
jgi:hypothetical protein